MGDFRSSYSSPRENCELSATTDGSQSHHHQAGAKSCQVRCLPSLIFVVSNTHTHIHSHRKPHISLLSLLWTYTTLLQTHTRTFSLALSLFLSLRVSFVGYLVCGWV